MGAEQRQRHLELADGKRLAHRRLPTGGPPEVRRSDAARVVTRRRLDHRFVGDSGLGEQVQQNRPVDLQVSEIGQAATRERRGHGGSPCRQVQSCSSQCGRWMVLEPSKQLLGLVQSALCDAQLRQSRGGFGAQHGIGRAAGPQRELELLLSLLPIPSGEQNGTVMAYDTSCRGGWSRSVDESHRRPGSTAPPV